MPEIERMCANCECWGNTGHCENLSDAVRMFANVDHMPTIKMSSDGLCRFYEESEEARAAAREQLQERAA
jgi:hypothetical protein